MELPAHYSIEAICGGCRGAIKSGDDRYRIGDRQYHAHCFDISCVGTAAAASIADPAVTRSES